MPASGACSPASSPGGGGVKKNPIGRSKPMPKERRATTGRSGLPVIDLGGVLRVPRRALDRLLDTAVSGIEALAPNPPALTETAEAREPRRSPRRRHSRDRDQLTLID